MPVFWQILLAAVLFQEQLKVLKGDKIISFLIAGGQRQYKKSDKYKFSPAPKFFLKIYFLTF